VYNSRGEKKGNKHGEISRYLQLRSTYLKRTGFWFQHGKVVHRDERREARTGVE
jgi:hypothetical protein